MNDNLPTPNYSRTLLLPVFPVPVMIFKKCQGILKNPKIVLKNP